ncbi:MAG: hypothetical protein AVDCRST_MAG61-1516 [uncultured Friedmanniella sp.]|uniref:DUF4386 family protein n=1 Tax=uncultured Friedmanniella sp. TaxID=335381 RepID=A0A6J4KJY8_9ACTN|nr:MAG: hypothetical protein AVDCRST_MAG61-1516 [uncultured Friedmanniella sp.]
MDTFVRWAGGCWILAGVLGLAGLAHPDSFEIGFAESSRQALWPAIHLALVLALILTLFGLAGLAVRHGAAWGRLGNVGTVLTVPGGVVMAGLFLTEALVFPVLARENAALLDRDGALLASMPLQLAGGFILLWFVGMVIVGLAVERAKVLPRGTGLLLAITTVLVAALAGPFVPVAGKVAGVINFGAQAWLGWSLLTSLRRADAHHVPDQPLTSEP